MPQNERLRVWNEELKKTSGGLTKAMLMKNKRGKIVSKKKSEAAKKSNENNLGSWLRSKGDKFDGEPKGFKAEDKKPKKVKQIVAKIEQKVKKEKVVNAPKKAPKKKAVPKKAVPKKAANAPKKAVPKKVANAPKRLTMEPMKAGEEKEPAKISVGNIIVDRPKRPRRKRIQKQSVFGDYDSDDD